MGEKIRGYKVFNANWKCRDKQYACPGVFEEEGELKICHHGMHFCKRAIDCFNYYNFNPLFHVAEVIAIGDIVTKRDKSCTNKLEIVRELTWEEVLSLVNIGVKCTGNGNTGDYNSGNWNTGNKNSGSRNTGDHNYGDENTGSGNYGNNNTGDYNMGCANHGYNNFGYGNVGNNNYGNSNIGDYNTGSRNIGEYNKGEWNIGDYNTSDCNNGCFNTTEEPLPLRFFNQPSDWTYEDWFSSKARSILEKMPQKKQLKWIPRCQMTEEEIIQHPEYRDIRGYLSIEIPEQTPQEWWDDLSKTDKNEIRSLPNFDANIFFKCTGIVAK